MERVEFWWFSLDTPTTIAVLENDSDADGDTLTVMEMSAPAHGALCD